MSTIEPFVELATEAYENFKGEDDPEFYALPNGKRYEFMEIAAAGGDETPFGVEVKKILAEAEKSEIPASELPKLATVEEKQKELSPMTIRELRVFADHLKIEIPLTVTRHDDIVKFLAEQIVESDSAAATAAITV